MLGYLFPENKYHTPTTLLSSTPAPMQKLIFFLFMAKPLLLIEIPGKSNILSGVTDCQPCRAGTYNSVAGSGICTPCTTGKVAEGGSISCSACPEDKNAFASIVDNKSLFLYRSISGNIVWVEAVIRTCIS